MSTINAILEADPDGTLHLPLPLEWRGVGRIEVTATLKPAEEGGAPLLKATPEALRQRKEALDRLRELGGLSEQIPDPVIWQREMREDKPLPGREGEDAVR